MSTVNKPRSEGGHAFHFDNAEHEFETSKFGIWLFLCTEVLMFGGLFVAYFLFEHKFPETFIEGATYLDWKFGAVNTAVLLLSSFTMVLSIYYAQNNKTKQCVNMLFITLGCGFIFMGIKYLEYMHKIDLGLLPGEMFSFTGEVGASNLGLYFSTYYMMTGLHGSHVLVGMGLIVWCIVRARRGEYNSKYFTTLECVGLFWHLVDLIWIYLFPLLYLVD